jgi:hypothetical protein
MLIFHDNYHFVAYVKNKPGVYFHTNPNGETLGWVESNSFYKNFSLFFLSLYHYAKISIMKYLFLPLLLSANLAFSAEDPSTLTLESKFGPLKVSCNEFNECQIQWKKSTEEEVLYINSRINDSIQKLKHDKAELFLIQSSHGDSCPNKYHIIHIEKDNFNVTSGFGNCNEIKSINYHLNKIYFHFGEDKEAHRVAQKHEYSIKTKLLNLLDQL